MPVKRKKPKKEFLNTWAFEPFFGDDSFCQKRMFGGLAAYVNGRMVMVLTENPGERSYRGKVYNFDIWNGVLLPTERVHHNSLKKDFRGLFQHPVLGKWLYLPACDEVFEETATQIAECIADSDERLGIEPQMRKP